MEKKFTGNLFYMTGWKKDRSNKGFLLLRLEKKAILV